MKSYNRLKKLTKRQKSRCIWCGRKCITKALAKELLKSDDYRKVCDYLEIPYSKKYFEIRLKKRLTTIEHVLPKCYGGSNKPLNLVMACSECNSKREHYGSSLNYEVLGMLHKEQQVWVQQNHKLWNIK